MKICTPTTRICSMCSFWNGAVGGNDVKPKKGMRTFWEYNPEEKQICFKTHFEKKGWNSCSQWTQKF
jgi:hypothetical protein